MKNLFIRIRKILWNIIKWFFILSIAGVILFRFVPIPFTPLMIIRFVEQVFDSERDIQFKKDWEPISNISPLLVKAVITSEDQRFNEHFGLDMEAIQKAANYNEKHKNKKPIIKTKFKIRFFILLLFVTVTILSLLSSISTFG